VPHRPVFHHVTGRWRPRWRGRIHGGATFVTIPAGIALAIAAPGALATTAVSIYVASLVALFATSASYHLLTRSERAQRIMQRLDHSMVYVLIAGTYTPVCLLALPRSMGIVFLSLIWVAAGVGIVLKVRWRGRKTAAAMYLLIGWAIVVVIPWAYHSIGAVGLALYAAGGIVFSLGAVLFYKQWPVLRPEVFGFHELWHVLTVVAVVLQFSASAVMIARLA
jgi:hemolysin III